MTATMPGQADDWGLWVDECGIFASGLGRSRWLDFTFTAKRERLTPLWLSPNGGEWRVMCGTRAEATEAREIFLEAGFHGKHVKVARLSACQAKMTRRMQEIDARVAAVSA